MRQNAWSVSGKALLKKSLAPLEKQPLSQRKMFKEKSIRTEVIAVSHRVSGHWHHHLCGLAVPVLCVFSS